MFCGTCSLSPRCRTCTGALCHPNLFYHTYTYNTKKCTQNHAGPMQPCLKKDTHTLSGLLPRRRNHLQAHQTLRIRLHPLLYTDDITHSNMRKLSARRTDTLTIVWKPVFSTLCLCLSHTHIPVAVNRVAASLSFPLLPSLCLPSTLLSTDLQLSQSSTEMGIGLTSLCSKPRHTIVMLGPDCGGRTTLLYRLKDGYFNAHINPTIGFNMEAIERPNCQFLMQDYGGGFALRQLTYIMAPDAKAFIFMCDSSSTEYLQYATRELHEGLDRIRQTHHPIPPILIFAAKQDKPHALSPDSVRELLRLDTIVDCVWHIAGCSSLTGEGIEDGMQWLESVVCTSS